MKRRDELFVWVSVFNADMICILYWRLVTTKAGPVEDDLALALRLSQEQEREHQEQIKRR